MRKNYFFLITLAALFSCNEKPKEPMYNTAVKTIYNFNKKPITITSRDTTEGSFNVYKDGAIATVKDEESDFKIKISNNPNTFKLIDFKGKSYDWKEENGYKLGNENRGDTLILKYMPLETGVGILKFGIEYKFYK